MNRFFKIKDKFFVGVLAGILANATENIFNYLGYYTGFSKYFIWHIAASAYFPITEVKTTPALIIGMFTDYTVAAGLGVITVYLLYLTGNDYYLFKGLLVSGFAWLFVFGVVLRTKIGRIDPTDSGTNLINLGGHILLGLLISIIIIKIGEFETKT